MSFQYSIFIASKQCLFVLSCRASQIKLPNTTTLGNKPEVHGSFLIAFSRGNGKEYGNMPCVWVRVLAWG